MLSLFRAFKPKEDPNKRIIFNEIGFPYNNELDYNPIIIFHADDKNYYYLRTYVRRTRERIRAELNIDGVQVNCSQIFWCKHKVLESCIDPKVNCNIKISSSEAALIKQEILNCIFNDIFYLALIEVVATKNQPNKGKSIYLNDAIYDMVKDKLINKEYSLEGIENLGNYLNNPGSSFRLHRERYFAGEDFCDLFLKAFFPSKVKDLPRYPHYRNEDWSQLK